MSVVAAHFKKTGSLVDTVEALRGEGKTLELLDLEKPGPLDKLIAENELLDPEHADGFLEPMQQRGLRRRWHEGSRADYQTAGPTKARRAVRLHVLATG
jgi:hypothetical protein